MKHNSINYSFWFFILGVLIIIVAPNFKDYQYNIEDFLVNVSATLICIALIDFLYKQLGGEPIGTILREIRESVSAFSKMKESGIEHFELKRFKHGYENIHNSMKGSDSVYVMTRGFESIKYKDVKDLFYDLIVQKKIAINMVIQSDSDLTGLRTFFASLDEGAKSRFHLRKNSIIYVNIYGGKNSIYVTPYLHSIKGEESPSFFCLNKNLKSESLYNIYMNEFNTVWTKSEIVKF